MSAAKRSSRMSKKQKELMINRLENDKFLLQLDKLKPSELPKFNYGWTKLAEELNKEQGAKKTVVQWKEALNELKVNTKRKARLLNEEATGTGGGPKKLKDLTDLEERLMALLSKIIITGAPQIPEAGLGEEEPVNSPREAVEVAKSHGSSSMEYFMCDDFNIFDEIIIDDVPNETETSQKRVAIFQRPLEAGTSSENPENITVKQKKVPPRKGKNLQSLERLAQNHENCLKTLVVSNNNLAQASIVLPNAMKRKKIESAVFKDVLYVRYQSKV